MGNEPAQRVRKKTPLTKTLETVTCCCPSETRKEPIEPEKLQTNFPFVSPLQTVRAPDTEPPVSHYRTCPYTRAGWFPPRQILHCPDDLAVTTQSTDFAPIEETLTSALDGLSEYYTTNQLRANPTKTQVSLFHDAQLPVDWREIVW